MLLIKKVIILVKYFDFENIFSKKSSQILLKHSKTNEYAIILKEDKKSLYNLIYNQRLIEIKIFKTYIKINLNNAFIRLSILLIDALIFFI